MTDQKKVLVVVEDDGLLRKIIYDKLRTMGYEVFQAEDGQEAINAILDKKPDLVLLDLLIPKVDGFVVLEKIRTYPDKSVANTPVVVLSNLWSDIDEYFVKANTDMDQVFEKVKNLLVKQID
ncbi:MAG: response regulator [Candidatus Doudnabacteria bacterium]|nr:response regulator [Candidatus Doudnabacteria bacterium]